MDAYIFFAIALLATSDWLWGGEINTYVFLAIPLLATSDWLWQK